MEHRRRFPALPLRVACVGGDPGAPLGEVFKARRRTSCLGLTFLRLMDADQTQVDLALIRLSSPVPTRGFVSPARRVVHGFGRGYVLLFIGAPSDAPHGDASTFSTLSNQGVLVIN